MHRTWNILHWSIHALGSKDQKSAKEQLWLVITKRQHMALSVSYSMLPVHNIWCQRAQYIKLQHTDSRIETEELFIITASSDLMLHYHSFICLLVCLMTGPQPLPRPILQTVQSGASSFKFLYHLISLGHSIVAYIFFLVLLPFLSFLLTFH